MNLFLVCLLVAACGGFIWADVRGISLVRLVRRALIARRIRKNLGYRWKTAWRLIGGRKC
jgi:hypothetical protein